MEIPGFAPLSGQPTLTNPLSQETLLQTRQTSTQEGSETKNTQSVAEQASTNLSTTQVVEQVNESSAAGPDRNQIGSTIDITV